MHPDRLSPQYVRIYRVQNSPDGPQLTLVDEFRTSAHEVRVLSNTRDYLVNTYIHDDADGTLYLIVWPGGEVSQLRVNVVTTRTLN